MEIGEGPYKGDRCETFLTYFKAGGVFNTLPSGYRKYIGRYLSEGISKDQKVSCYK